MNVLFEFKSYPKSSSKYSKIFTISHKFHYRIISQNFNKTELPHHFWFSPLFIYGYLHRISTNEGYCTVFVFSYFLSVKTYVECWQTWVALQVLLFSMFYMRKPLKIFGKHGLPHNFWFFTYFVCQNFYIKKN